MWFCFRGQKVGVIVRLERESFQVLANDDKLIQVKHQAISKKKDSRHAVALDSDNNQLQVKDVVKVLDGKHTVCDHSYTPLTTHWFLNTYSVSTF